MTIVGAGGLGAPVAQDLAFLGVIEHTLVDADIVGVSDLNRLKGATPADIGEKRVVVATRMIESAQPAANVSISTSG